MNDQPTSLGCSPLDGDLSSFVGVEILNYSNTTYRVHIRSDSGPVVIYNSYESSGVSNKSIFGDNFFPMSLLDLYPMRVLGYLSVMFSLIILLLLLMGLLVTPTLYQFFKFCKVAAQNE